MNYYPHHIGDYLKDTAHLSMIEDGAYRRLIDLYYLHEKPLPSDKRQVYRLARASATAERKAIDIILDEYFTATPEGFRHTRCDEEIESYQDKSDDDEARKENEKERQRRHRQRRKELFAALREHDVVPAWDTKTADLETLLSRYLSRVTGGDSNVSVTPPATAIPITNPNNQEPINKETAAAAPPPHTHAHTHVREDNTAPPPDLPVSDQTTPQARFAELLRSWELVRGKVCKASANDARLATWAERGISEAQLRIAYDLAVTDRINSGDNSAVNAGFVDTMLAKVLAASGSESALAKSGLTAGAKPWPCSWSGIVAKGEELGITQQDGEQAPAFKSRVISAAGLSETEKSALRTDWGVSL